MMAASSDDEIVLSYIRDPDEHVAAMREAGRRLVAHPFANAGRSAVLVLLYALAMGAIMVGLFHVLPTYVYPSILRLPPIDSYAAAMFWLAPTLVLVLLFSLCTRLSAPQQFNALRKRIRPGVEITVTVRRDGTYWASAQTSYWFGWSEVADITLRNSRIEFTFDALITYIPAAAFADTCEQAATLQRILALWRAANPVQP